MNADEILAIAEDWSYWDRTVPASVPRRVDLPDVLHDSLCLVVQGVRRCGKSTLLRQLIDHYDLERERCAFLNLEVARTSPSRSASARTATASTIRSTPG